MEISTTEKALLRQYLLGQQSRTDLQTVEERLMTESTLYDELQILEDELVDQYVRGEMSDENRAQFENHFLVTPDRRQKLRFAKALNRYVKRSAGEQAAAAPARERFVKRQVLSFRPFHNAVWNYALAAAIVTLVVGISWFAIRSLRDPIRGLSKVYAVTLTPGGISRGEGEIQIVTLPAGIDSVRLRLVLPSNEYHDYAVELHASDGATVLERESLKATLSLGKSYLEVEVPSSQIKHDDYRLRLRARTAGAYEDIASYNFRIIK